MCILLVLVVVTMRHFSLRQDVNRNQVNYTGTNVSLCCILTIILYATIRPGNRVLPVKITGSQLVRNFPAFYGTRRFIAAFTIARHLSLSWTRPIQSMPLIPLLTDALRYYSSIYALVFKVVSGSSKKTLYAPILSLICATCLAHLIVLVLITRIMFREEYKSFFSSLCNHLHPPVISSSFGQIPISAPVLKQLQPISHPQCDISSFTAV